jgi:tRNA A-37 threonylcarbamoyl transferase component Bud32
MALQLLAAPSDPALLDLPWGVRLEEWPEDQLVVLPRGISRHVVRFVRLGGNVYAVKEVGEQIALREYGLLRQLERRDLPAVEAVGVVSGRVTDSGEELDAALVTRHLQFSLPYRALFSSTLRPDTATRLLDALAALLVRMHTAGFYWGDCSLSNTLFRRDAGAFAAYLVDAETGELHGTLSTGQREYDLDLARTNIAGELLDLEAGGLLHESIDAVETSDQVVEQYRSLWTELLGAETFDTGERFRIDQRIRRLNDLGFDVAELNIVTDIDGRTVQLEPKVVDAGHHSRRLLRLTGLDVEENQARRLLNDLDAYRAAKDVQNEDEEIVAHRWVTESFEPVVRAVPKELRGKLEPAEIFHEVLEHRWFLSERAGRDVGLMPAARSYVDDVLTHKPDEQAVLGSRIGSPTQAMAPFADEDDDLPGDRDRQPAP